MSAPTHEPERVRRHTSPAVNARIDRQIAETVHRYLGQPASAITDRIKEIEREWDIERVLETNASTLALAGVALAATAGRKWLVLPGTALSFLLLHGIQGWCPPVPILRRLGVRTRREIDRERFALKFLRGDFKEFAGSDNPSPEPLLAALRR